MKFVLAQSAISVCIQTNTKERADDLVKLLRRTGGHKLITDALILVQCFYPLIEICSLRFNQITMSSWSVVDRHDLGDKSCGVSVEL